MSTPKPAYPCRAKEPSQCPYHAPFHRMEEAANNNDSSGYLKACKEAEEINKRSKEMKRFEEAGDPQNDTVVNLEAAKLQVSRLFKKLAPQAFTNRLGRSEASSDSPDVAEKTPAQIRPVNLDPQKEVDPFFNKLQVMAEANDSLRAAQVSMIFSGEKEIIETDEAELFYNTELRYNRPTVKDWEPQNSTQAYVVTLLVDGILDQKEAAFENAGIKKGFVQIALEDHNRDMGLGDGGEGSFIKVGAPTNVGKEEDGGVIANYDEGWLHTMYVALEEAKTTPFPETNTRAEKQAFMKEFLTKQLERTERDMKLQKSEFTAGAVDAWDLWLHGD